MGTPKYAEKVVTLETEWRVFRTETFPAFREELKQDLNDLGDKVERSKLNGETDRVKFMSKRLGDPEDVEIIANVIESHKRWRWMLGPFTSFRGSFTNALVWTAAGLIIAWLNTVIHASFPAIP